MPQSILTKIGFYPFALSMSKGHSWFDKPVLSEAEGLTTHGTRRAYFHPSWCPLQAGMLDSL